MVNFALDPIVANIAADVVALDTISGTETGGWRTVKVDVKYQEMCHDPRRLMVWVVGATSGTTVIYDSGENSNLDLWYYLDSSASQNPSWSGYDTVYHLAFFWDTTCLANEGYTIMAALQTNDPHGDGIDINPDPVATTWVHQAGAFPTGPTDPGTPGGSTVSVSVVNAVITAYKAKSSPLPGHDQDVFLYDPDGASALSNPTFEVTVDYWESAPMAIWVWLAATAWGDTRPMPEWDPFAPLEVTGPGTYTVTWDGTNPGYEWWTGEWGTWSFDVDLYVSDDSNSYVIDHFYAKTHDGQSAYYDVLVSSNHSVWWHYDETATPPGYQFRCNYVLNGGSGVAPSQVDLVTLRNLTVQAAQTGPTALGVLHDNIQSYPSSPTLTEDDTLGTWRTVFTGQTASGAEHRRDGRNPRILATNQTETKGRAELCIFNERGGPQLPKDYQVDPGSFVLVNKDDDDGADGADNSNEVIDGANDKLDMAKMTLYVTPGDAKGWTIQLVGSDATKVRVFNESGTKVSLPETIALSRFSGGAIDYYVEGLAAGSCTFSLEVKKGATLVCSPAPQAKVTVKDYCAAFNDWGAWPGGAPSLLVDRNPTETVKSTDLGLTGNVKWAVNHGGTAATIVSHTPTTGTEWSEIVVRYENSSTDSSFSQAAEIKAYGTGTASQLAAVRRTVFKCTWEVLNFNGDLDNDNDLRFPETTGEPRNRAGFNWDNENRATRIAAKMEAVLGFEPTGINWPARGVSFVYSANHTNAKWQFRLHRLRLDATLMQPVGAGNRQIVQNEEVFIWDGDSDPTDAQYPTAAEPNKAFRIDALGFDTAIVLQGAKRVAFQEVCQWHNGNEWCGFFDNQGAFTPYWYANATAVLPDGAKGGDNNHGEGMSPADMPNSRPVANAGADQNVTAGQVVTLHGTYTDADNDLVLYAWKQIEGPSVTLSDSSVSTPTFAAPAPGPATLKFLFQVADVCGALHEWNPGNSVSALDTVVVSVGAP